jgi:2-keto-4-pentenoate hydratase/2-oxohepta-3-ene-1,7-dioic acid hydratase in catechol pathway
MRIVRFETAGKVHVGEEIGEEEALRISGDLFGACQVTDERLHIERRLAPVVPTDILCIGHNYRAHIAETGAAVPAHPVLFMKAGNALNHPEEPIVLPERSQEVDYEGELVVVIGRAATNVSRADALDHVFGYTCGNDVSARNWQIDRTLGGGQFVRGKSFDGFAPLGPVLVTTDEIANPNALQLRTTLNGATMQESTTADMIFDVATLIAELSSTMTLRTGAIIFTGTPSGVGYTRKPPVYLQDGDEVVVEIDTIGRLRNPVRR